MKRIVVIILILVVGILLSFFLWPNARQIVYGVKESLNGKSTELQQEVSELQEENYSLRQRIEKKSQEITDQNSQIIMLESKISRYNDYLNESFFDNWDFKNLSNTASRRRWFDNGCRYLVYENLQGYILAEWVSGVSPFPMNGFPVFSSTPLGDFNSTGIHIFETRYKDATLTLNILKTRMTEDEAFSNLDKLCE